MKQVITLFLYRKSLVLRHAQGLNCDCPDPHCNIQEGTCVSYNTPEGTILYHAIYRI